MEKPTFADYVYTNEKKKPCKLNNKKKSYCRATTVSRSQNEVVSIDKLANPDGSREIRRIRKCTD